MRERRMTTNTLRDESLRAIGLSPAFEHTISDRITAFRHHWRQARKDKDQAKLSALRVYAPKIGVAVEGMG